MKSSKTLLLLKKLKKNLSHKNKKSQKINQSPKRATRTRKTKIKRNEAHII